MVELRFAIFLCIFAFMALLEVIIPRRTRQISRKSRWFVNFGLNFTYGRLLKLIFNTAAVGTATMAQELGWGFLNINKFSYIVSFIIGMVFLDFMIYLQHVMSHALPAGWRLHMIHHSDLEMDVTTAIRFHPFEIVISMIYKLGLVVAMGVDPFTVLVFETVLNGAAQFNHSNIYIPSSIDRILRWFIVTPDMHAIHHSMQVNEANSNFGFFLSIWDRMFGTYKDKAVLDAVNMQIGLLEYRKPEDVGLISLLLMPFTCNLGQYSMRGEL